MSSASASAAVERQIQVISLVFAGTTAVCIWDLLNNVRSEYRMVRQSKFSAATVAYCASRIGALAYSVGLTTFLTSPLPDCLAAIHAFESFYPIASAGSAFLFYTRVRAVYGGSRFITVFFGILWLSVVGTGILVPFNGRARSDALSGGRCLYNRRQPDFPSTLGTGLMTLLFDTLAFFAISYRLVVNFGVDGDSLRRPQSPSQTTLERFKLLFSGANLPSFSRCLLADGQKYYMITVITNIGSVALIFTPGIGQYHGLGAVPSLVLTSIMACRVYRRTKLGFGRDRSGPLGISLPTLNPLSTGARSGPHPVRASSIVVVPATTGSGSKRCPPPRSKSKNDAGESFMLESLPYIGDSDVHPPSGLSSNST